MRVRIHLKVNDQVEVIAGKDKGRVGKVLKVRAEKGTVVVEKINMIKKHMKPSQLNQQGGIIDREAPIQASNLMLICPKCSKTSRLAKKVLDDGTKVRVCKKCNESVEARA